MNTEALLRKHFETAAARVDVAAKPVDEIVGRVRRGYAWFGVGAAALLLAVVAVASLATGGGPQQLTGPQQTTAGPQPTIGLFGDYMGLLPASFDWETALPLFSETGDPAEVALDYLTDRIGVEPVVLSVEDDGSGYLAARWGWGKIAGSTATQDEGNLGWVLMRQGEGGNVDVIAATTDVVDLSQATLDGGNLSVVAETSGIDAIVLDVLDLDGRPIPGVPHPEGLYTEGDLVFGTAGMAVPDYPLEPMALFFSTDGIAEPVIIRVEQVGGTQLTVSEVVLQPGTEDVVDSSSTTSTEPPDPSTTTVTSVPEEAPVIAWTAADAERDVENYLSALAAGAYEQAAWPVENNGAMFGGQMPDETPVGYLGRVCSGGACLGPYHVVADGPGLIDQMTGQASSTVTVTHVGSGESTVLTVATFEGQRDVIGMPPLVPSDGSPGLVEQLFGDDLPNRVVVQRFDAFEIWENGQPEWVTNWWADYVEAVEQDVALVYRDWINDEQVVDLRDPLATRPVSQGCLGSRDGVVLLLEGCWTGEWSYTDLETGAVLDPPIDYQQTREDGWPWFTERGATVVAGEGDAEGNLVTLSANGVDLAGDDYLWPVRLSVDGSQVAYVDHHDPNAISHFSSAVVVVKDVTTGTELGRWVLDGPVLGLEFSGDWVVAWEGSGDGEALASGEPPQIAVDGINLRTGAINRVETATKVFLP